MARFMLAMIIVLSTTGCVTAQPESLYLVPPPLQCDHEPTRRYRIKYVSHQYCGAGALACMTFQTNGSCLLKIVPGPQAAEHIRHEKAHCNCPNWKD